MPERLSLYSVCVGLGLPGIRAVSQLEFAHGFPVPRLTLRGSDCAGLADLAAASPLFLIANPLCRVGLPTSTLLCMPFPQDCRPVMPSPCIPELTGQRPHMHCHLPCADLECHMAHGFEEVRREAAVMAGKHDDNYKTRLCTGFTFKHRCTKGSRCKDAHGAADLRWVLRACMCFVMLHAAWGLQHCLWHVARALLVHGPACTGKRAMAVQCKTQPLPSAFLPCLLHCTRGACTQQLRGKNLNELQGLDCYITHGPGGCNEAGKHGAAGQDDR